jgi:hypothetical protein
MLLVGNKSCLFRIFFFKIPHSLFKEEQHTPSYLSIIISAEVLETIVADLDASASISLLPKSAKTKVVTKFLTAAGV